MIELNKQGYAKLEPLLCAWYGGETTRYKNALKLANVKKHKHDRESKKACDLVINEPKEECRIRYPGYVLLRDLAQEWGIQSSVLSHKVQEYAWLLKPVKCFNRLWAVPNNKVEDLKGLFKKFRNAV